jgi:hypothetical protein
MGPIGWLVAHVGAEIFRRQWRGNHTGRKWLFISEWSDYKVWKIPLNGDSPPHAIHLDFLPDNFRITEQGTLLIAGQNADPVNVMTCRSRHVPCQAPFTVVEMNPITMDTHVLAPGRRCGFWRSNRGGSGGRLSLDQQLLRARSRPLRSQLTLCCLPAR